MKYLLLISALLLTGCDVERYVNVTIKTGTRIQETCAQASNVIDPTTEKPADLSGGMLPVNAVLKCIPKENGMLDCSELACTKKIKKIVPILEYLTMIPSEFQFKYDHDPKFKSSIQSYEFR